MNCESDYLQDVNSKDVRYEAEHVYSLYSKHDFLAGQNCCGHHCSEVKNANQQIVRQWLDHGTVFSQTKETQYSLVTNHTDSTATIWFKVGFHWENWFENKKLQQKTTKKIYFFKRKIWKKMGKFAKNNMCLWRLFPESGSINALLLLIFLNINVKGKQIEIWIGSVVRNPEKILIWTFRKKLTTLVSF